CAKAPYLWNNRFDVW
nr:immunoglobulin heavy chain junction region [Macaca mulatta]